MLDWGNMSLWVYYDGFWLWKQDPLTPCNILQLQTGDSAVSHL